MDCLEPEEIAEFLAGRADSPQAARVEAHLDRCDTCRELVAELVRGDDCATPAPGIRLPAPGGAAKDTLVDGEGLEAASASGDALDPDLHHSLSDWVPGRYHVLGEQGQGGQARVLAVYDTFTRREIAYKELTASREGQARSRAARFVREARLTAQLNHPSIVHIHEIGRRPDGRLYYTMPMVRGITLDAAIQGCRDLTERLALLDRFLDLCRGIAHAHSRGVIHRDLKPQNIMVGDFGETIILDWGLAKIRNRAEDELRPQEAGPPVAEGLTSEGLAVGTPGYMSPEQARAELDAVDEQSDVWGLGAVLHEILTGQPPFDGASAATLIVRTTNEAVRPVREHVPALPPDLGAIVDRALQRGKAERYPSAQAMADDVAAYLSGRRVTTYEYGALELLRLMSRRYRGAVAAAGITLFVIVVSLVALSLAYGSERRARTAAAQALGQADKARRQERRERLRAQLHLARALLYRADREAREKNYLAAEVFAAASLLRNPGLEQPVAAGPSARRPCAGCGALAARAVAKLQLGRYSEVTGHRFALKLPRAVHQVAYAPTGGWLALACDDHRVRLLDPKSGRVQRVLSGHGGPVMGVAFSPDGRLLASTSRDRRIRLWSLPQGTPLRTLEGLGRPAHRVAFSPDGRSLASAGTDGRVVLWRVADGARLRELAGHAPTEIKGLAFAPDGRQLATAGSDRRVRLWDLERGSLQRTLEGYQGAVNGVAYSPDGRYLASVSRDFTVRSWDLREDRQHFVYRNKDAGYMDLAFWPQRHRLVVAQSDGVLRVLEDATGRLRTSVNTHAGLVSSVAVSPDGRQVAAAGQDGSVRGYALAAGHRSPVELAAHRELIFGLAYTPNGRLLVSGSLDGTVTVWRTADGELLRRLVGHREEVLKVACSADGALIAAGGKDGTVVIWEAATGRERQVLRGHRDAVYGVRFSPDSRKVATGSVDGTVRLWNVADGRVLRELRPGGQMAFSVEFSPDGSQLAVGSSDHAVTTWDVGSGRRIRRLVGHTDAVTGVSYLDGGRLVSGGKDGLVILWDLATGKPRRRLTGHRAWVNTVKSSADRRYVATASDDRTVRVWAVDTGEPVFIVDTSTVAVGLAFAPDGQTLAVGDGPNVRIYRLGALRAGLDPRGRLRQAERAAGRSLQWYLGEAVESGPEAAGARPAPAR